MLFQREKALCHTEGGSVMTTTVSTGDVPLGVPYEFQYNTSADGLVKYSNCSLGGSNILVSTNGGIGGYPDFCAAQCAANVDCFYSIKKLSNICSVELDLREFYLEPILDCSGDWLLIGEKKYCGQHASTKGLNLKFIIL